MEVLHNWLSKQKDSVCKIKINETKFINKKVFVYAGNMGVAQGMRTMLDLVEVMQDRLDIGFLFVGRGSDSFELREEAARRGLGNVIFHDEIDPDEIAALYAQCHVGIVALDERHKTHNIPGKFLSYMDAGLPVFAVVNEGNDLVRLIDQKDVGRVCTQRTLSLLKATAVSVIDELSIDVGISHRCRALANEMFSSEKAVKQIIEALKIEHFPT